MPCLIFYQRKHKIHTFMLCRYDMEDAMVLNKSSVDRGMCHGHIYQVSFDILKSFLDFGFLIQKQLFCSTPHPPREYKYIYRTMIFSFLHYINGVLSYCTNDLSTISFQKDDSHQLKPSLRPHTTP